MAATNRKVSFDRIVTIVYIGSMMLQLGNVELLACR